jgi:uncharacterized repeat protein (TIGR03806 family)
MSHRTVSHRSAECRSFSACQRSVHRAVSYPAERRFLALTLLFAVVAFQWIALSGSASAADAVPERPRFDVHHRLPWVTGNIQGSPDAADPFTTEKAFPGLTFTEPLSVSRIPGQAKFGVATRPGKIYTFDIRSDVSQSDLLIDIRRTIYGFAFHPQFETNGYFYVAWVKDPLATEPDGSAVSRFQAKAQAAASGSSWKADVESEQVMLRWPSGGHNGGCLRFGPDGYLYLATGDGSGIADGFETGQDLTDLLGAILRVDVDHASEGRAYSIPQDNPFVSTPDARPEIWSFGHRQVWKFSFDDNKRLWAGEVGQDLWEMIYVVERGGNYGWSVQEGLHPFRPERRRGPGEIQKPVVEHPHSDFRSVTGGYVSQTDRLPGLKGAYIYGDYDTGKLWSLKYADGKVTEHQQLADTQIRIVEFAQDREGDVYIVDFAGGGFHRIVSAPPQPQSKPFPRKLSETGLFASTKDHVPAAGVIPYSVNAPLWSDGAEKDRFIALPGTSQIEFDAVTYPHGPDYPDIGWRFPDGTVLVKTFSLALDTSHPEKTRRLETRLLHYRQMPGNDDEYGAQFWNGYTYVWNEDQTDAELLDAAGLDQAFTVRDAAAPGGMREQVWRFPSRSECTLCHTMASKYILGVTTLQMNREFDYGGHTENQLAVLNRLGIFKTPLPKSPETLPRLADYRSEDEPLHLRARAYLHSNCAHCHRKWGGGNAEFELHASVPLTETLSLNTRPGQGTFGLNDPRILVPGEAERSLIVARMQLDGLGRMPHVAVKVKDDRSIAMLKEWVNSLRESSLLSEPGAIHPRQSASAKKQE